MRLSAGWSLFLTGPLFQLSAQRTSPGLFLIRSLRHASTRRYMCTCRVPTYLTTGLPAVATITRVIADVSPDGSALLLRVQANGVDSDFTLAQGDVGGLVHMLLALAAAAQDPAPQGFADQTRSIPVDAVSIGETVSGDALLGLQIGSVELAFELPKEKLRKLAETLLSVSADRSLPT